MRTEIHELFRMLTSADQSIREDAHFCMHMVIEAALVPGLKMDNQEILNRRKLPFYEMTKEEAVELMDKIQNELFWNHLTLSEQSTFLHVLWRVPKIKYFTLSLKYIEQHYEQFDNQQAYSELADLNPQYFKGRDRKKVCEILQQSNLINILIQFEQRNDDHLNDGLFHMWGKIRSVGFINECINFHYLSMLLRLIKWEYDSHILWYSGANDLLNIIKPDLLEKQDPDQIQVALKKYDTLEILDNLEKSDFNEMKRRAHNEDYLKTTFGTEGLEDILQNERKYQQRMIKSIQRVRGLLISSAGIGSEGKN